MEENFSSNDDNTDNSKIEEVCGMCHRPESMAGSMFHLPGGVCLCSDCMKKSLDAMSHLDYSDLMNGRYPNIFSTPSASSDSDRKKEQKITPDDGKTESKNVKASADSTDGIENAGDTGDTDSDGSEDNINSTENTDSNDRKNDKDGDDKGTNPFGIPNIQFLNWSDLGNLGLGNQRPKAKKTDTNALKKQFDFTKVPKPSKLKEMLDEYVIGQEHAKKVISVAVYNHYKRVSAELSKTNTSEIEKSNILMIGPTGCGKTYLVQTLARLLDVPLAIADATSLTEAGYIGDDIESVVSKLLAAADNDVERAECGIIFVDEIDKIARKKNATSRDVSGESVQQGMLKILEGAEVEVPVGANSKNAMVPLARVNTRNILFICGGAFPDLDDIIKQRLRKETSIGFNAELKDKWDKEKNILSKVTVDDIKSFGMIPEFVGRLPIICTLEGLTEDSLVRILREPKNAILKQYEALLAMDEVKLEFTDEALHAIAAKALERETGARGLRAVIEDFMLDIMYEIPRDDNIGRVTITRDYIEGKGGPVIDMRGVPELEAAMIPKIAEAKA